MTVPELTLDDLQNGHFIFQYKKGFRFGMDAVLLSGYGEVRRLEKALDLGSGTGIIPLLLASKSESREITGIELFKENVDLAEKSIEYNSLSDRIKMICGDIRDIKDLTAPSYYDVIFSNPPYMPAGHGFISPDETKAAARHEIRCTIEDVAMAAAYALKPRGRFYMVHRPERLTDIFRALAKYGLETKRMRFVHPHYDREPNLVLMEAQSLASSGLIVEKPLCVYGDDGAYTDEVLGFYNSF